MISEKFKASLESGAHHLLHQLEGNWKGRTKVWFEPDQLGDDSPCEGKISIILGGRIILHEYQGEMQGEKLEGLAIYGCQLSDGKFQSAWIDSFHMGTGIMFSEGKSIKNGFGVHGTYPAGNERWGWRTEIELVSKDEIVITAYNISPSGEEAKATETRYTRA